jgi:dissimilatory sulfite reductase (desulfoviridin) alpha/beta subunit
VEWDKVAAEEFARLPLSKSVKENARLFAEKMARKSRRNRVILEDVDVARKVAYGNVSEEKRQRQLDERVARGETDLRLRMEVEGREILKQETNLFKVVTCTGQATGCRNLLIETEELKEEIEQKLRELKVTEMMADLHRDDEPILAHHRFNVSISGCPVGCTAPEIRSFGVHGVAKPKITDAECSECYACVDVCWKGAISIRDGGPRISKTLCDLCGFCMKACPTGTIVPERQGYRVLVGGRSGRFSQAGVQLFRNADRQTLMAVIEAAVKTIKEEADGYEDLTWVVNRIGVGPIFQRMHYKKEGA